MQQTSLVLDRERQLKFRIGDLLEYQRRMGCACIPIMGKLKEWDIQAVIEGVYLGLRWEDKALTREQTQRLVEDRIEAGGSIDEMAASLVMALAYASGARPVEPSNGAKASAAPLA